MKKKKDIEIEREELGKKLDMLRQKIQEREARETKINLATKDALTRNAALDEEFTAEIEKFISMKEKMTEVRRKNKSFQKEMIAKLQKCMVNTLSASKRLVVVPMTPTLEQLRKMSMKKSSTCLHSWAI